MDYLNNMIDNYIKTYSDKIEEMLYEMIETLGYKGDKGKMDDIKTWLDNNNYEILAKDKRNGIEIKTTYRVQMKKAKDINDVVAEFTVLRKYGEELSFAYSNIFYY